MADPRPPRDWRDVGIQPAKTTAGKRDWQQQQKAPAAGSGLKPTRNTKRIAAVISLVLLFVVIGIVIKWLSPLKPACLVVIGSGYEENILLPHNALGWHGLTELDKNVAEQESDLAVRFPWEQPSKIRRAVPPIELKADQTWKDIWKDIPPFKEKTLILFLSLHGLADSNDVYLLANDPRGRTRIPFKDVLDSLQTLDNKHILLLLDISQTQSYWPLGMLHNDVIKRLKEKYEERINTMGNVVVICSAGPDQRSWPAESWQNSIFCHYVTEGLKGAAAASGNERITAKKLFDYVEARVDQWAQSNRARNQKPILLGQAGLAERTELVHIQTAYQEQAPQDAPGQSFDTKALAEEWQRWKNLAGSSVIAHSPHQWRLYQDMLLRYEQLIRAGDPTGKASALKDRLRDLESKLIASQFLSPAQECMNSSFPLYQVLGYPSKIRDASGLFNKLWKNNIEEDRIKLLAPFSPVDRQHLQVGLGRALFDYLSQQDKPDGIDEWFKKTEAELSPRQPVELQLLKMLRYAADPGFNRLALSVRVLAEEAALSASPKVKQPYLYSEVIFPSIQKNVEAADDLRRQGEDLLFGDSKEHGDSARKKLNEAKTKYGQARLDADELQYALAVRDEACANLPYLARWLTLVPPDGDAEKKTQELRDSFPGLAKNLADLGETLDLAEAHGRLAVGLQTKIDAGHKSIRNRYHEVAAGYTDVGFQRNWHEIDHALSIPPVDGDVELRVKLLRKLQKVAGDLHAAAPTGPTEDDGFVSERKRRQLAALEAMLKPFDVQLDKTEPNVDESVQSFFLNLPDIINKKSLSWSPGFSRIREPAKAGTPTARSLSDAANLCRIVPGGLADEVSPKPYHPVERLRRLRMVQLLQWQAERTWQDHWFEPGLKNYITDDSSFYLPVGRSYIKCARELVKDDPAKETLLADLDKFAEQKLKLARLKSPEEGKRYWTTELVFPLTWKIELDGDVPKGQPMGWLKIDGAKAAPRREEIAWPPSAKTFPLKEAAIWDSGSKKQQRVAFQGIYRGQKLEWEVLFERPRPDVIVRQVPAPKNGALAVRMDSTFNYGAVSIVLDTSGSMDYVVPGRIENKEHVRKRGDPDKRSRFDFAAEALESVLRKIPDRTYLSMYRFGGEKETEVEVMRAPSPWDRTKLRALTDEFEVMNKNPHKYLNFESPIARAIFKSMDEGFPEGYKGPKVVLVLTDGADNFSFGAGTTNERVKRLLLDANEKHPDTELVVVCFIDEKDDKDAKDDRDKDYKTSKAQFSIIETFLPLPGQIRWQPKAEELGSTILEMLQPRLRLFDGGRFVPPMHPINHPDSEAIQWAPLAPKQYRAGLSRGEFADINVDVKPAQNLFMVLKRKDKKFLLERGVLGRQPEAENALKKTKGDWLVSLLGHEIDVSNQLSELVVFENLKTESKTVRQPRPGFVWLELTASPERAASPERKRREFTETLRWENTWDVAAPGYRITMGNWPFNGAFAEPKMTAWFWPKDRDDFLSRRFVRRISLPIGKAIAASQADQPAIESIQWEEGKLAVRVRFPVGKPVMVDFGNAPAKEVSVEHKYYLGAGRYTAYFTGLTEDLREAELFMVDLAAFKNEAERVVFPADNDRMPERITVPRYFVNPLK